MVSCLNCLLRNCFDTAPEEDDSEDSYAGPPPRPNVMLRLFQPTSDPAQAASAVYRATDADESLDPTTSSSTTEGEGTDRNDDANCCRASTEPSREGADNNNRRSGGSSSSEDDNPQNAGLKQFWRKFKERFNALDIGADSSSQEAISIPSVSKKEETKQEERTPMLTQASSFDSTREIPTILSNSIIYPGSDLQREMAKHMSASLAHHDDECVICMEGFSEDNPRMPTLCGCGENKTYFHLPCLYQWIDQSKNCPSCAKRLRWEEF